MMKKIRHILMMILALLFASACTLDGTGVTITTPTHTLLATFPPAVAPSSTPAPAVTAVTQVAITQVPPIVQIGITQVAVVQNAVVPTSDPNCVVPTGWQPYTVIVGDTLGVLAITTFSSVADLAAANCIVTPDLIYAGQILYVPQTPGTFLPTPITNGVDLPTINNILVEPAIVMNAMYTVAPGIVTVRASAIENAAVVTFYMAPTGATSTPVILGEDSNMADGATTTWQVGTVPLQANVWAIASDATGRQVTSEPILVQANM